MKLYVLFFAVAIGLFSCAENETLQSPYDVLDKASKQLNNWETLSFTAITTHSVSSKPVTSTVYKLKKVGYEPHLKLFFFKEMNQQVSIYYKLASLAVVESQKKKITTFDYSNDRSIPKYLEAYMGDTDNLWGTIKLINQFRNDIVFVEKTNVNDNTAYVYKFQNLKLWLDAKSATPLKLEMPDGKAGKKEIVYSALAFDEPMDESTFTHPTNDSYVSAVFGVKKEPMLNIPAPDWRLLDLNGKEVSLSDFKGAPIFIEAWVSSCSHCMESLPKIKQIQKEFGEKVKVVTVNFDYNLEETKKTFKEKAINYMVLQGDAKFDQNYDLRSFPSYFVINSGGIVVYSDRGTIEGKKEAALFDALEGVK